MTPRGDSISLYLTREGAERAGNKAIKKGWVDFAVTHGRVQWDDHSVDYGFKVSMRGERGQHVAFL